MTDMKKLDRTSSQLGLPPMELAESSTNVRSSRSIYNCMFSTLQKVFMLLVLVTLGAGTYVLLLKLLESADSSHTTEIILVTGTKETGNITLHKRDMDIIFHLYNKTTTSNMRRKKRSLQEHEGRKILSKLKEAEMEKVKSILRKHRMLCQEDEHKNVCKELIDKLRSILHKNDSESNESVSNDHIATVEEKGDKSLKDDDDKVLSKKREARPLLQLRKLANPTPEMHPNFDPKPGAPLTDTCMLARLLKNKYPHLHGVYDAPELPSPHIDHSAMPQMRFPPSMPSYLQDRDHETHKPIIHPQDLDIFMSFLTQKPDLDNLEPFASENSTTRKANCPEGKKPCKNLASCIDEKHWCDGKIHCGDSSDEGACSCKSRVDSSRLCDGYNDCPLGEDELGCFGCDESMFSCEDVGSNSQSTCYTKEQRCNNVMDCPNNKDETDCNMLAPSLLKKTMFAISGIEGFLHRNVEGDWYAVCKNPFMGAYDACRRETGLIIRPPFIQMVPIDPLEQVDYINTGHNGILQETNTCYNHSAVYVTCPDFLCGTRVPTNSQLLKQNEENQLFGRNKRYSLPAYVYNPYHMVYNGFRVKREMPNKDVDQSVDPVNEERNKRTESRVVGGKPSEPAAWPWMVAMYRDGMFHCGGVIFTQSWIISAAHCVSKFWDHYYEIQVGMLRRFSFSPQEQIHRVTHVIENRHYSQTNMKNDLSLLRVEPSIQFSRWVRPICLPSENTAGSDWHSGPAPGTACIAVGWGATAEHGPDPDHMREVEVPIWNKCKHREDVAGNEICAGFREGGKDACQGDSGGPLLCRNPLNSQQWYLAGVVSHGDGCARKDEPGVYTRVSLFVKWIKYHTTSQTLPIVQPLQDCPGFRCKTGIFKCLPNNRKCDKIVDCLSAEDEKNCDFSLIDNLLQAKSSEKFSRQTESKEAIKVEASLKVENHSVVDETKLNTTMENIDTGVKNNDSELISKPTHSADIDFEHASTLEISASSNSYEDSVSSSKETATESPKSGSSSESISSASTEMERGDMQSVVTFTPRPLKSDSIVKEMKSEKSNSVEDITTQNLENFHDEFETTTILKGLVELNDSLPSLDIEQTIESKNKSEKLVIDFLPNSIDQSNETDTLQANDSDNDQIMSENSSNMALAKNLPEAESKSDVVKKIEDLIFSQLQPATRRKHNTPKEFECRRIFQMISFSQRCDHKADCEDGTDEVECSCIDYLSAYNENLLCDGIFDCADGQDEIECYSCPDQHFLCKRSEICLPNKYVCDGIPQCPSGEDEFNCFALTNGREIFYDIDEKPKINVEGYLTEKNRNDWQVVCEDDLTEQQQEESATHICHYLGFSSANRFNVKYVNLKEDSIKRLESSRKKRYAGEGTPLHFAYRSVQADNTTARKIITEPQLLKEECVPNVTKTCKSLYVYCDRSLFTDFILTGEMRSADSTKDVTKILPQMWPWIAKVYLDGDYKCTGILVDLSWVVVSDSCLFEYAPSHSFITVVLGSHRTLDSVQNYHEKVHVVDLKKILYRSRIALLHLKTMAEYSNMVKPMLLTTSYGFSNFHSDRKTICVAIGQDNNKETVSIFMVENMNNCNPTNVCFNRTYNESICEPGTAMNRQWAGLISCHDDRGWYPAASFVDSRGECDIGEQINATAIENLLHDIKELTKQLNSSLSTNVIDGGVCDGVRCSRGLCVPLGKVCDGVTNCEDGSDETVDSCVHKNRTCGKDPYVRGCECSKGQLKCRNGKCISKELYGNGVDDCGDSTDEPKRTLCSDYLAKVMPTRLCDGILHCHDRSDEDPLFCKCFAKKSFPCSSRTDDVDHCVAPDMVCDGVRDCPNGEDERKCIGLSATHDTPHGTGQVIIQSHGVWRSKCYSSPNHTKSELETICRELGFISGHAKEIKDVRKLVLNPHNNLVIDSFVEVSLNNQTSLKIRNTNEPLARAIVDKQLIDCYPVFIECL